MIEKVKSAAIPGVRGLMLNGLYLADNALLTRSAVVRA